MAIHASARLFFSARHLPYTAHRQSCLMKNVKFIGQLRHMAHHSATSMARAKPVCRMSDVSSFTFRMTPPSPPRLSVKSVNPSLSLYSARRMALGRKLLLVTAAVALSTYFLHVPLPDGIRRDRWRLQFLEFIARLVYLYPLNAAAYLGPWWQLQWLRVSLGGYSYFLGPWIHADPFLNITDTHIDAVPVRIYQPPLDGRQSDGAIIFIHGGAFVRASIGHYEYTTRELARLSRMFFVSVEYRLAPEHVYPAAVIDCEKVTAHFLRHGNELYGIDPAKIVVMGDSSGGNLAAVTTQRLRHRTDVPQLKLQVLIYPQLHLLDFRSPSFELYYRECAGLSFLDPWTKARYTLMYLGLDPRAAHQEQLVTNAFLSERVRQSPLLSHLDERRLPANFTRPPTQPPFVWPQPATVNNALNDDLEHIILQPDFSPLMQEDMSNLPRALVVTCQFDILRDEGAHYARRLSEGGTAVTHTNYEEGFHGILGLHNHMQISRDLNDEIVTFIHRYIDL